MTNNVIRCFMPTGSNSHTNISVAISPHNLGIRLEVVTHNILYNS